MIQSCEWVIIANNNGTEPRFNYRILIGCLREYRIKLQFFYCSSWRSEKAFFCSWTDFCLVLKNRNWARGQRATTIVFHNFQAGFVNYYLMEEGKSCVKMALRVGQEYRVSKITDHNQSQTRPHSSINQSKAGLFPLVHPRGQQSFGLNSKTMRTFPCLVQTGSCFWI